MSKLNLFSEDYANKEVLCIECTPKVFSDGSLNDGAGEWHNMFPKKHWSEYGTKEKLINDYKRKDGSIVNAIEYFKNNNSTKE